MRTSTYAPKTEIGRMTQGLIRLLTDLEWIDAINEPYDNQLSFLVTLTDTQGRKKTAAVRLLDVQHVQSIRQSMRSKKVILLFVNMGRGLKDLYNRLLKSLQPYRRPRRKRTERRSDRFVPVFYD